MNAQILAGPPPDHPITWWGTDPPTEPGSYLLAWSSPEMPWCVDAVQVFRDESGELVAKSWSDLECAVLGIGGRSYANCWPVSDPPQPDDETWYWARLRPSFPGGEVLDG